MDKTFGLIGILVTCIVPGAACGAVEKFAPGEVTVGGEIGRRMEVTAEKILHHTDVDNVFVKPFREHDAGTFGGFVGYGMLLDAVVKAAAHGVGGDEMRAFKTRRLKEIAATMTPDGRISMYADKPGFWDNHEQAYLIQAFCLDHRVFGCAESLATAERLADSLIRMQRPMTLGTESAFMALWRETGKDCYRKYLEETCRIRGDIGDYERHLTVNGVAHVYTWLARALGQVEYGKAADCVADVRGAADEAFRRMFSPMLSVSGTCTGSGGEKTWGETWGDSQTGLGHWGETCASAYQMRLAGEMMTIEPDSRYGDLIERTLYNGFFAAQSPDGLNYRYWSPFNEKAEWYPRDTYCCPNNYKRMVFEIPDLVYFRADDGLYVNLYAPSELKAEGVKVVQRTSYPADGKISFEFNFAKPSRVRFRVPRWTGSAERWRMVSFPAGASRYELDFVLKPRLVRGVHGQHGRAAVLVGPVVYGLSSASAKEGEVRGFSEAARYAAGQGFARTGDVVKVVLEKSYVPGHVRDTRTLDFVRFSDPQRVRTYFAVAPDCKTVPDELYDTEPSPAESPDEADVRKAVSEDAVRPVRPIGLAARRMASGPFRP